MSEPSVRLVAAGESALLVPLIAGFRDQLRESRPSDAEIAAFLPGFLRDPSIEFACASLDGRPVGYTQTRFFDSVWSLGIESHLEDLFVVESARRSGAGRALLRAALERARVRGARAMGLNTNEHNEAAQALYRAEGFRPVAHARYPGGREVLWGRSFESSGARE